MGLLYPPYIQWEVTPNCNHKCIHCYNYWRTEEQVGQSLTAYHADTKGPVILNIANRIVNSNPVEVTLTGGEPLMVFEDLKPVIDMMIKAKIAVTINTNAALVNDEVASFLEERGVSLFVSFPCSKPEIFDRIVGRRNAFIHVSNGLRLLRLHHVRFLTNTVVTALNLPYLYETACYLQNTYHLETFCATRAAKPLNASSEFDKIALTESMNSEFCDTMCRIHDDLKMKIDSASVYTECSLADHKIFSLFERHRRCNAGRTAFSVTTDGLIKACARDSKTYGNILEDDFSTVIERMTEWQDGTIIPQECKTCRALLRCNGGCRIEALTHTGFLSGRDPSMKGPLVGFTSLSPNQHAEPMVVGSDDHFMLNPRVTIIEEKGCYRLSLNGHVQFLSGEFIGYVRQHSVFSCGEISNYFNISYEESQNCLTTLLSSGILIKRRCG